MPPRLKNEPTTNHEVSMPTSPWGSPSQHGRRPGVADDADYEFKGQELQFVQFEFDPVIARQRKRSLV